MAKLGDLWVRLGLKKEGFSKGLQDATKESRSWASSLTSVLSKAKLAFGAVTAAVGGVILAIKNLSIQNQALGDAWGRMVAGMAGAWDALRTSIASMDFSHVLSDMREANRLARDLYDAQDALGEISTSYNISLARQMKHINELKTKLRDLNLSDEERIAAGNELLSIYSKLEKDPTRGLLNVSDKTLNAAAKKLGYNMKGATEESLKATRSEVENFFVWLGSEAGEKWNQAYADAYKDPAKLMQTNIDAQNAGLSGNYRALLWNYQSQFGDKDRERMEKAIVGYYQQEAKFSGETLAIQRQINTVKAQGRDNHDPKPPKIETPAKDPWQEYVDGVRSAAREAAQEAADVAAAQAEVDAGFEDMVESFRELKGLTEERPSGNNYWQEFADGVTEAAERAAEEEQRLIDLAKDFNENVAEGIAAGCQTVMDSLMGLERFNAGSVLQALLSPLADMAVQEGKILVASGLGIEAVKKALESLHGVAAIAAGAALIAVGTAAKSGLAALAKSGAGSTSVTAGGDYGGGTSVTRDLRTEMTIYVTGKMSGNDIEIAGQRTINDWSR